MIPQNGFKVAFTEQLDIAEVRATTEPSAQMLGRLTGLAGVLLGLAGLLWLIGGHHVGFATLNGIAGYAPVGVWSYLTSLGDTAVALALFLPLSWRNWHLCRIVLISAVLGLLWTHGFKQLLPLPRPAGVLDLGTFTVIGDVSTSGTFPSGHAQTAMMLATVAALCLKQRGWQVVVLVIGILAALSRVVVGMHWPVDTLAGAAGGILTTVVAAVVVRRLDAPRAWPIVLLLSICVVAALLVATGHPSDHPAAQPWLALTGIAAFVAFLWPWVSAQRRVSH